MLEDARPVHLVAERPGAAPLLPTVASDLEVPLVGGGLASYADLDVAATGPALAAVASRVAEVLPQLGSVHRGAGLPSRWSTALYESARSAVAAAVGAREDDVVVFTRNTTDAINLLASVVPGPRQVVVLDLEHHANLLPWQRRHHRCLEHAPTLAETLERLDAALAAEPTALVAITGASNVTGELVPVARVAELAHRHGARVAVDAAQLAPHRPIDLASSGVDYVAFSGHKLYAPFGAGVLVGRRDWLDAAPPYLAGGGVVRDVTVRRTTWALAPQRHEAGTPNLLGAVAIAAALEAIGDVGAGRLEAHETALRRRLVDGLGGLDGVRLHQIWQDAGEAIGVVCFEVAGREPGEVAAYLSAEHGVGVRDGRFCAHPLLARLGLPGALRASVGVGTTLADVDRLAAAVRALVTDGPRWAYVETPSGWDPVADDRPLPASLGDLDLGHAPLSPCIAAA
jgi:selenocysteine lyase/cysteine desulfurase